jgi:hypothetical protein
VCPCLGGTAEPWLARAATAAAPPSARLAGAAAGGGKPPTAVSNLCAAHVPTLLPPQSKQGQLMAIGRAREGGIEVAGSAKLLGYTAFEDTAGALVCVCRRSASAG